MPKIAFFSFFYTKNVKKMQKNGKNWQKILCTLFFLGVLPLRVTKYFGDFGASKDQ
tara:strand:- start:121 stop:288 length:168 start_codon:yes stop_codon:yes gene_type:complete